MLSNIVKEEEGKTPFRFFFCMLIYLIDQKSQNAFKMVKNRNDVCSFLFPLGLTQAKRKRGLELTMRLKVY